MNQRSIEKFISLEALGGMLLLFALLFAILIANSPLSHWYQAILDLPLFLGVANLEVKKPAILWVNEGLMAIFFMILALEIKREIFEGELSNKKQVILPFMGAIGGIVLPILIYLLLNHHDPQKIKGWPIATTTDIAFVLGVIALLGDRVPRSLKVLMVALSIVDDILAVIIIAAFYTESLSWWSLGLGLGGVVLLIILNLFNVSRIAPYLLVGVFIWFCVVKSGVHATLAGIAIGLTIPVTCHKKPEYSPLKKLEKMLHPWVALGIMPLFVFMNGGLVFENFSWQGLLNPVPLAIALGLFLGKSFGAFTFCWLAVQLRLANLPDNTNYTQLLALSFLTGIGFTMSLFLLALAFTNSPFENLARQGVLLGSILAGITGALMFICRGKKDIERSPVIASKL